MSKETDTKQTSSQEDSHANPSVLQEREEERKMTGISGMKLLESSESVNLDGSLGKMLKALLTSPKVRSCSRYKKIWKQRVSKSNVLLFQLQASVRGIKGKESGLLPTPVVSDHLQNRSEHIDNWKKRAKEKKKQGINLHFALRHHVQMYPTPTSQDHSKNTVPPSIGKTRGMDLSMRVVADEIDKQVKIYPTPTASDIEGGAAKDVQMKDGRFFRENKKGERWGVKLRDAMEMMPTARDHKDMGYQPTWKPSRDKSVPRTVLKNNKPGGKLNPTFVEMLMAYPMNWTKIEPTELKVSETQSFPSSQENLDSPSSKQKRMYRTPTAMDVAEDSFVFAAKLLKGKINRSSNSRVQITLSTDVAMEYLKSNPHLIDEYDKPFKIRPNLPNKFEFISYLKSNSIIKDLANKTDLPKTKIEHWFRKDKCFSYPSIEDWNKIKPYLKTIQFDDELTYEIDEDWKS